ncbi:MAG TPA: carbohydrate ABC transporter permease [Candidatus Hydrogenedentes bacterium]|nr:carbohydrate ABC transporter permease [Candidatus Hydrogenedentota bacterium]
MRRVRNGAMHLVVAAVAALTLLPFVFVLNNSFRTNSEIYHSFFGLPNALKDMAQAGGAALRGRETAFPVDAGNGDIIAAAPDEALARFGAIAVKGYRMAWRVIRPYMLNTFFVCAVTVLGVGLLGSMSAYVLSRYRFPGSKAVFIYIVSTMMFPGVLTLVPSFLLVKQLGLLNTYWAMILPYIAGGQVFATFVFKSFFDGLPEDLFESARIDGAGHFQIYVNLVVPLSKPVLAVVMIMNILSTWNNFLWPFITNIDGRHHVIASGLYVLATSPHASNMSTLFAAYMASSVPLLLLFIYATKPFIQGVTSGAFKA